MFVVALNSWFDRPLTDDGIEADALTAVPPEASAPSPATEPNVESTVDTPSAGTVSAFPLPAAPAAGLLKVILLPARADVADPAAKVLADSIRQATLRSLRGIASVTVIDVSSAEFAAVAPANAGPLWAAGSAYDALRQQYGDVTVAEISVQSSMETATWHSRLDVRRPRGGLSTGASVSRNSAAGYGNQWESIGYRYAREIADDNSGERDAEAARLADARKVLIDATRSDDERMRALFALGEGRGRLDSESIAAAVDLAARSTSPETRKLIWSELRGSNDAALAQPMSNALLSDPDPEVRIEAALGLESFRESEVVAAVLAQAASGDGSADVRLAARIAMMDFGQQAEFTREILLDRSRTPAERLAPSRMVPSQTLIGAFRNLGDDNAEVELAFAEIISGTGDPDLLVSALLGLQAQAIAPSLMLPGRSRENLEPALVRALVKTAEVDDERVRRAALATMRAHPEQPEIRAVLESVLEDNPQLARELRIADALARPPAGNSGVPAPAR